MTKREQVSILRRGGRAWNSWREANPSERPDLRGAVLREANLSGANFSGANFSGADFNAAELRSANLYKVDLSEAYLSGTNLRLANLSGIDLSKADLVKDEPSPIAIKEIFASEKPPGPDLRGVDLSGADFRQADLRGANLRMANLSEVDLSGANLRGANLSAANLARANLSGANFRGANLNRADLYGATLYNVIIISRNELNKLSSPLSEDQKAGLIFLDEKEEAKKKLGKRLDDQKKFGGLLIKFNDDYSWKSEWLANWLLSFQLTYNNLFYLSNTEDTDIETIESKLLKGCQVNAQNDIELKRIQNHSPMVFEYVQYAVEHAPQVVAVLTSLAALVLIVSKGYKTIMEGEKVRFEKKMLKVEIEERKFDLDLKKDKYAPSGETVSMKDEMRYIKFDTDNKVILEKKEELLFLASRKLRAVLNSLIETASIGNLEVKMQNIPIESNDRDLDTEDK